MGLDDLADDARSGIADATNKEHVGFNPDVCEGCPERGSGPLKRCGLCNCPTLSGLMLHQGGMVPPGCPRIAEHERTGDNGPK